MQESSTIIQLDQSPTKNRFSSPTITKPRTILPNVKPSSQLTSPLKVSPNYDKSESTSTLTTSKRHRKPVSKFNDFVVENPLRNLNTEMKRVGQQDETRYYLTCVGTYFSLWWICSNLNKFLFFRCLVKGCNYLFTKEKLSVHMSCHIKRADNGDAANSKFVFSCPQCRNKFLNWRNCAMHLWKSHQVSLIFFNEAELMIFGSHLSVRKENCSVKNLVLFFKIDVDLLTCSVCENYKTIIPARLETHMVM